MLVVPATGASAATTTTSTTVPGITGNKIRVGGLGYAGLYGDAEIGARARFARENLTGGVFGRTFDFIGVRDDGGDPAAGVCRESADRERTRSSPSSRSSRRPSPWAVSWRAPVCPTWAGHSRTGSAAHSVGFGFTGCATPTSANGASDAWPVLVARDLGESGRAAAIVTEDTAPGRYALDASKAAVKSAGMTLGYAKASLPVPPVTVPKEVTR